MAISRPPRAPAVGLEVARAGVGRGVGRRVGRRAARVAAVAGRAAALEGTRGLATMDWFLGQIAFFS